MDAPVVQMRLSVLKAGWLLALGVVLTAAGFETAAWAGGAGPSEYAVKAAYLFNFAKFIDWPPAKFEAVDSPFIIGVLGVDPFGAVAENVFRSKAINGRKLVLRHLAAGDDIGKCHILFVSPSELGRTAELAFQARKAAVLLVSEGEGFLEQGGMIGFYLDSETVRFAVNLESADRAGLRISSKLLSVAKIAKPEKRESKNQ